jgi:hypothetical protein
MEVTKIKSAEDQLNTAIDLYFKGGDEVSIHTLACAANEILDTLCKNQNLGRSAIHDGLNEIKADQKKKVLDKMNEAKNFFKHAGRDFGETITWDPGLSEYVMWDAASLYRKITKGKMTCKILIFSTIFRIRHAELWSEKSAIDDLIPKTKIELIDGDLELIYKQALKQCNDGKFGTANLLDILNNEK